MKPKKLCTSGEAAKTLGISKGTLLRWLRDRKIQEPKKHFRVGKVRVRCSTAEDINRAQKAKRARFFPRF